MGLYSLRKSKQILRNALARLQKKGKTLSSQENEACLNELKLLDRVILKGDRKQADSLAKNVEKKIWTLLPKNIFDHIKELGIALVFALVVATLVRTMWFELYEIPTGSMRPTFKEQDRLIASKTSFGVNIPLVADQFIFEPKLVKNTDVVIFTVENMDVYDPDTLYFYFFPGKRLLIKRLIGKPGDTLYFYGGKIYGIDSEGNEIKALQEAPWISHINHVPFISFEGREKQGYKASEFLFYQSGIEIGKLQLNSLGGTKGFVFNGQSWVSDDPKSLTQNHNEISTLSDFWGFKNYAMARLLTSDEVNKYTNLSLKDIQEGLLYLELSHTPSLSYPQPLFAKDSQGNLKPLINPEVTLIGLTEKHITRLMNNLYTARFVVNKGYARRYSGGDETEPLPAFDVQLPGVEDGTYEFYDGKAYKVFFGGMTKELPKEHPLYARNLKMVQTLFNLGIDFNLLFAPRSKDKMLYPQRYSYFRDGSLYVMGTKVFNEDDPILEEFIKNELKKQEEAPSKKPYVAFIDRGAPVLKDGSLDKEFIKTFGLKVPPKMYYVLGDNFAMSADSRDFGFVPEENLRGSPSFILWPAQDRFGPPKQPPHPFFTLPTILVWGAFGVICLVWYLIEKKRIKKPLFIEE
jgi:signal peptidase I